MKHIALLGFLFAAALTSGCSYTARPVPDNARPQSGVGRYQMYVAPWGGDHFTVFKCDSVTGEVSMVKVIGDTSQSSWHKAE